MQRHDLKSAKVSFKTIHENPQYDFTLQWLVWTTYLCVSAIVFVIGAQLNYNKKVLTYQFQAMTIVMKSRSCRNLLH